MNDTGRNTKDYIDINDNRYDNKSIESCNKHIQRLILEKGRIASELERLQSVISTYKMIENENIEKHKIE